MGTSLVLILVGVVFGILMIKNTKKTGASSWNTSPLVVAIPLFIGVAMSWLYAYANHAPKGHENQDAHDKIIEESHELAKDISSKPPEVVDRANWHKFLIARTDYYDTIIVTQFADKTKRHIETIAYKNDGKQNPIIREVRIAETLGAEKEWVKWHEGIVEEAKNTAPVVNPVRTY